MNTIKKLLLSAAASLAVVSGFACSRVTYLGDEGLVLVGRTLDWRTPIPTNLYVYPQGISKVSMPKGNRLEWTSKYGSVYAVGYDGGVTEGMNEKGLVVNGLFCKESVYREANGDSSIPVVSLAMFPAFFLDNFATVDEIAQWLSTHDFAIYGETFDGGTVSLLHWAMTDASGDTILLEYVDGKLTTYRGRELQVLTNDPVWPQMQAINKYWNAVGGVNMLPGTVRSSDRFVRADFFIHHVPTNFNYQDAWGSLNSIMGTVSVPYGYAIFSYQANEDMEEGADEHSQELLSRCINEYNEMYGTAFSIDTFDSYRKDIAKRMKQKDLPQVDILLVVNMFLTGFDAKPLNTLYLDKNLIWHTLVQAYSRTNRVYKKTKQFGQIVSYRNIKKWQDDALKLFSGDGDPNEYLLQNYEYYVNQWVNQEPILRKVAPTVEDAGQLQNEDDIRAFIIAFRTMTHTLATLKTFSKFEWDDLAVVLGEGEYEGYKSWYLYYYDQMKGNGAETVKVPVDVDFDIELVRTDRINVVYILNLLKSAKNSDKSDEDKQKDIDLIIREIERSDNESMRYKSDVMKAFIQTRFFELPAEVDIMEAYEQFEKESMQADIEEFAYENDLKPELVTEMFSEYTFSGNLTDERIRVEISYKKLGLIQTTNLIRRLKAYVEALYKKYKAEGE